MGKAHRIKFLTQYGLPATTELTISDISALSNISNEILLAVFRNAKVYVPPMETFSFHKKVKKTKPPTDKAAMDVVYAFIAGKVKESDKYLLV